MRISFHFIQLSLIFILFSSCGDVLSDYDIDSTNPLDIDNEICTILNERQAVSAHIFKNDDSLTNENLFSLHSIDSNLFVSPSNDHSWSIAIDSTSFFMLLAPQQADSHLVTLNFSSEFELYDGSGNLIIPDNDKISMQNVAGCSNVRIRQVYSGLYGLYLARLYNPNVSTINLVFVNTNDETLTNFISTHSFLAGKVPMSFPHEFQTRDHRLINIESMVKNNSLLNASAIGKDVYKNMDIIYPLLANTDGLSLYNVTKVDINNINFIENQ